jgi:hypothetical protein
VTSDARLQRTDWRDAAKQLGAGTKAIVVTPAWDEKPLQLYAKDLGVLPSTPTPVTEVLSIAEGQPPRFPDPPPPPGFRMAEKRVTASYELIRYVSDSPQPVSGATLTASKIGPKPPFFLLRKDSP